MDLPHITFDDSRARTYRKTTEVLAYRSSAPFRIGEEPGAPEYRAGSWIIIPLDDEGRATEDLHGCDGAVFEKTYEPSSSSKPHRYVKTATVRAYQPGGPFAVTTTLADGTVESEKATSTAPDGWIVRAPGGEVYPVENEVFTGSYTLSDE